MATTVISNNTAVTQCTITGISMAASDNYPVGDRNQDGLDIMYKNWLSVQYVYSSASHADATLAIHESNDRTNWSELVSAATLNGGGGAGSGFLKSTAVTGRYVKFVFSKGSCTAGTLNLYIVAKRS